MTEIVRKGIVEAEQELQKASEAKLLEEVGTHTIGLNVPHFDDIFKYMEFYQLFEKFCKCWGKKEKNS